MLDIKFIRDNPEIVKRDLQKRNEKEKMIATKERIFAFIHGVLG